MKSLVSFCFCTFSGISFAASACPGITGGLSANATYVANLQVVGGVLQNDTGCNVLVTVTPSAQTVTTNPNTAISYDSGGDDVLVGVVNNGAFPITSVTLTGTLAIFAFDAEGVCQPGWTFVGGGNPCIGATDPARYGGPNITFSNISPDKKTGVANFGNGGIPPGGSAFFSLEAPVSAIVVALPSFPDTFFQVRYASNLTNGSSVINISNTGANGAPLAGPGFGPAAGNTCVNVYAFSPDEQLISCCSCLVTPNGLISLSVTEDLVTNTLTGVRPNSVVVKLVNSGATASFSGNSCTNSAALAGSAGFPLAPGLFATGTTVHAVATTGFATTETPFLQATLSPAELASITNRCANIIGNGSSFGICLSCRSGGLSSSR